MKRAMLIAMIIAAVAVVVVAAPAAALADHQEGQQRQDAAVRYYEPRTLLAGPAVSLELPFLAVRARSFYFSTPRRGCGLAQLLCQCPERHYRPRYPTYGFFGPSLGLGYGFGRYQGGIGAAGGISYLRHHQLQRSTDGPVIRRMDAGFGQIQHEHHRH